MRFLYCLARAVVKNGFKILADAVPFGGALYDVAVDTWQEHRQGRAGEPAAKPEAALAGELQGLAQAPAGQVRREVAEAVQQAAGDQPPELQLALSSYLTQVPAMVRRVSRRPSDPTGTTVPPALAPRRPEDLLSFLPPKPLRFKVGDRPLPGIDWELEELLGVGGFGEVWKARNPKYKGLVAALKFCLDVRAAAALDNEAEKLDRVMQHGRHAGIVPLRQVYLKADPPCLEYEFVEEGDLTGLIQELHSRGEATPDTVARNAAEGPYLERSSPVGSYKPNAFGLFDLHGNVWEWCSDWYDENYYNQSPRQDPQGPQNGTLRVLRGGSWDSIGQRCRSACRAKRAPDKRHYYLGFRLVCVAPRTP
jgi:hypothetical protein